jgi:hypothetical protein
MVHLGQIFVTEVVLRRELMDCAMLLKKHIGLCRSIAPYFDIALDNCTDVSIFRIRGCLWIEIGHQWT